MIFCSNKVSFKQMSLVTLSEPLIHTFHSLKKDETGHTTDEDRPFRLCSEVFEPDYITEHAMAADTLVMLYINYNYKMNIRHYNLYL